jgi:hypothetical protein
LHPRFSIPRFACPKSVSENANRLADKFKPATSYLAQRPKMVAVGAATAAAAAVGITAAVASVGPATAGGAIGAPGAVSYSGAVHAAAHKPASIKLAVDHGRHQQAKVPHQAAPQRKHATAHHPVAQHAPQHASHRPSTAPAKPYLIYDSTTPSAIPAHRNAAVYATGSYAASPSQVTGRSKVLWIDTTGGDQHASVLDVEPGDATPSGAATWARNRLAADPHAVARLYTFRNEWPAVQAAVHTLPQGMQSRIRWWIADPTGVPHIVPGSAATQWYWGSSYDITTASPRF